jgi:hypothetical protein
MKIKHTKEEFNSWNGEQWIEFALAASEISNEIFFYGPAQAQARLRKLCGDGEVRAVIYNAEPGKEAPELIPPSRWRSEDVDVVPQMRVAVSESDLRHWIDLKVVRGDHKGPWEHAFYSEKWLIFDRAILEFADKLAIPPSAAEAQLHKLCASGVIRSIGGDPHTDEQPKPIPPSQWHYEDYLEVMVSNIDFCTWLNRQPAEPKPKVGKVPLIMEHLKEMFPNGVPDPAHCPRKQLRADLLAKDKRLDPLDDATLKRAIDLIRNDPKRSEVVRSRGVSD